MYILTLILIVSNLCLDGGSTTSQPIRGNDTSLKDLDKNETATKVKLKLYIQKNFMYTTKLCNIISLYFNVISLLEHFDFFCCYRLVLKL